MYAQFTHMNKLMVGQVSAESSGGSSRWANCRGLLIAFEQINLVTGLQLHACVALRLCANRQPMTKEEGPYTREKRGSH
jgi:hypothetical protein